MTPERLQEIRDRDDQARYIVALNRGESKRPSAVTDRTALLEYIDTLHRALDEGCAEINRTVADNQALRRGQGTAPKPATPGGAPFHTTHPIPDSTGGTR